MQIPNLPTDNLYKFIAITGLILVLLSWILPEWAIHELNMMVYDLEIDAAQVDIEATAFENKIDQYMQVPHKKIVDHSHNSDWVKSAEIKKGLAKTKAQISRIEYIMSEIRRMKIYIVIGNIVGSFLMYYGFKLWYGRLQKYQDAIIKSEAEKQ